MGHTNSLILAATLICLHGSGAWAQTSATTPQQTSTTAPQEDRLPVNIHGTIRSKYEYQTQENEGRFEANILKPANKNANENSRNAWQVSV